MLPGLDATPLRREWLKLLRRAMTNGGAAAARLALGSGAIGDLLFTAVTAPAARETLNVSVMNWLINPDGAIAQAGFALTSDDNYLDDCWYGLTQTGSITPSQVSNPEDGFAIALRLSQTQPTAQRMGRAQIIIGRDSYKLRGKTMTFGGRLKLSTSANVRMAILAWTGTENVVTSDVVSDWTNATYTAGTFFNSSNLSVVATSSTAMTANTAGNASVTGTIPSNATNVIVFYWTEATVAQNVTLDAWGLRLIAASTLVDCTLRTEHQELALCQQFVCKTFDRDTTPAQNAGSNGSLRTIAPVANQTFGVMWRFPVRMWTTPSLTFYNTSAANANWSGGGVTGTATAAGEQSVFVIASTPTIAAGTGAEIHVLAQARL